MLLDLRETRLVGITAGSFFESSELTNAFESLRVYGLRDVRGMVLNRCVIPADFFENRSDFHPDFDYLELNDCRFEDADRSLASLAGFTTLRTLIAHNGAANWRDSRSYRTYVFSDGSIFRKRRSRPINCCDILPGNSSI
ncbi:MAG: hypothetical protein QM811_29230 [Pirellulales bacterium]